ncbi:hypothetical protein GCM10009725_16190 [Aeromicrobium tamlense]
MPLSELSEESSAEALSLAAPQADRLNNSAEPAAVAARVRMDLRFTVFPLMERVCEAIAPNTVTLGIAGVSNLRRG